MWGPCELDARLLGACQSERSITNSTPPIQPSPARLSLLLFLFLVLLHSPACTQQPPHQLVSSCPASTASTPRPSKQKTSSQTANMSMRIVPASGAPSTFKHTNHSSSAPSAPGIHDTLRHGVGISPFDAAANKPASSHPLEARLKSWEATQEAVRMETLRRTFGIAEPIRRGMELKIVRDGEWRPMALGAGLPSVHEDILKGREDTITWDDVFTGNETRALPGFHDEMEKKLKIH
ncbi:proteasome maturation factor UMP1 domain-containing protein [Trichoderma pleuroticola]